MTFRLADGIRPKRLKLRTLLLAFGLVSLSSHSGAWAQSTHIECLAKYDDHPNFWIYYEAVANPPDDEDRSFFRKMRDGFYLAISENPPAEVEGLGAPEMTCGFTSHPEQSLGPEVNGHGATTTFVQTKFLRGGLGYVSTGKEGPKPYRRDVRQAPSPATLVIETAGPTPEQAAAERAKQSLELARADALIRARTAASQARSDAKYQADLAKLYEDMRKRGSAQ